MVEINHNELMEIEGGGRLLWYVIGGAALLIVGIIDGIINPNKCRG